MPPLLHTLWTEPRSPGASGPLRRDSVLVVLVIIGTLVEGMVSEAPVWPRFSVLLMIVLSFILPWRRQHPLLAVTLAFGATGTVQLVAYFLNTQWSAPIASIAVLILPYALTRWASGRDCVLGISVIALSFCTAMLSDGDMSGAGERIGASLFLMFPAVLGVAVRYRDSASRRENREVRLRERERLARELHDTVAHHVSAIAIQAQAGRAVAHLRPQATVDALAVIEEEASRTLADMRQIVGALRQEDDAPLAPAGTLADIQRLGQTGLSPVPVDVTLSGQLDVLGTSLESTLYRVAQEAMTNAFRHARNASHVSITVTGSDKRVHLRVTNDGSAVAVSSNEGFGLPGMRERVSLLGGTLYAGPQATGGWQVDAWLPKVATKGATKEALRGTST